MSNEESIDKMLSTLGCQAVMYLTKREVEELKEIETEKKALEYQALAHHAVACNIARRQQAFFQKLYKRLGLDKSMLFQANWRTGEVTLKEASSRQERDK